MRRMVELTFLLLSLCYGLLEVSGNSPSACSSDEFPCTDGTCIDKRKWCDSVEHCPDDSDELYCYKRTTHIANPNRCDDKFFLCADGRCIPSVGRCDGYVSCQDGSDEAYCGTTINETDSSTTEASTIAMTHRSLETITTSRLALEMAGMVASSEHATITNTPSLQNDQGISQGSMSNVLEHKMLQADSIGKPTAVSKAGDLTRGYKAIDSYTFRQQKTRAEQWLLSIRDENFGWNDDTPRALTALYMSDESLQKQNNEKLLMSKQLHLKISVALIRNQTENIPLSELALYINALSACCENPRNFYGHDLVDMLRHRTNSAQASAKFVSPLVYLTLCLSNWTTFTDVKKIHESFASRRIDKMGLQALASLAGTCISNLPDFSAQILGMQIAKQIYEKVKLQGFPDNIYELGLIVQALNEARINQDLWKRSNALTILTQWQESTGSFGDILATYYVLPILSGKSLASLSRHCYPDTETGMTPLDVLMNSKDEKEPIRFSLYFGEPVTVSQSISLRVGKATNLLDVMRIAETKNSIYRFKFDMTSGKPAVYSIGGISNDAEQGLYWTLHVHSRNNTNTTETLQPFDGDIRSYIPNAADHVVFWMKKLDVKMN